MDHHLLALHRQLYRNPRQLLSGMIAGELPELTDESRGELEAAVSWLQCEQHHLIEISDDDYPVLLKKTFDPPPLLFARGDRSVLERIPAFVAIVGSRSATRYGLSVARRLGEDLAGRGVCIVSGMALGIDAAGHEGALLAGGPTIAVLGTGCDVIYPRRHWRLAERIAENGLLVSEFPLGTPAFPANFPRRNRIVTGISSGTVVIEAAEKSGSLVSARLAVSEGREVMVIPGLLSNRQARGCHELIRDGATLIRDAEDVLEALGLGDLPALGGPSEPQLSQEQSRLLACLARGPMTIDMMTEVIDFPIDELAVELVSLEVLGLIVNEAGSYQLAHP